MRESEKNQKASTEQNFAKDKRGRSPEAIFPASTMNLPERGHKRTQGNILKREKSRREDANRQTKRQKNSTTKMWKPQDVAPAQKKKKTVSGG